MIELQSRPSTHRRPDRSPDALRGIFDYDAKRERLEEVEREPRTPTSGTIRNARRTLGRERSMLDKTVNGIRDRRTASARGRTARTGQMEDDGTPRWRWSPRRPATKGAWNSWNSQRMFSGKMDSANAFVDIQAGAGGTRRRTGPRC